MSDRETREILEKVSELIGFDKGRLADVPDEELGYLMNQVGYAFEEFITP